MVRKVRDLWGTMATGLILSLGGKIVFNVPPGHDSGVAVSHLFLRFGVEGGDGIGVFCGDMWPPAQGSNYLLPIPILPTVNGASLLCPLF